MKFEYQRKQMVESQLRANLVIDESILDSFSKVKLENFLSDNLKSIAYIDDNIFVNQNRFILRPFILGKLISNLNLKNNSAVLDIGSCTGYSSAILANLFKKVYSVENDQFCFEENKKNLSNEKILNVKLYNNNYMNLDFEDMQFDNVLINGELNDDPLFLINLLKPNGKITAIFRDKKNSYAVSYIKKQNSFDKIRIFDASSPLLIDCKNKEPAFTF